MADDRDSPGRDDAPAPSPVRTGAQPEFVQEGKSGCRLVAEGLLLLILGSIVLMVAFAIAVKIWDKMFG